jgi:hypothetical protein
MAGMRKLRRGTRSTDQSPQWAVTCNWSGQCKARCCAASDDRGEPILLNKSLLFDRLAALRAQSQVRWSAQYSGRICRLGVLLAQIILRSSFRQTLVLASRVFGGFER